VMERIQSEYSFRGWLGCLSARRAVAIETIVVE